MIREGDAMFLAHDIATKKVYTVDVATGKRTEHPGVAQAWKAIETLKKRRML